jgi:predicted ATP-binding protein involved in virulence
LIVYYSTQRLFKDAYLSNKQRYDAANGRRNGYLQCLKENAIKSVLNEWLANAVTRRATLQIKQIDKMDNVLTNVEEAIKKTLINFLELSDDFLLKIYQEPDYNNELFVNYDSEHDLPISYYSDGFRNILYLIIDLVWRASQLNPWLTFTELSEKVFGVVTIDEIDLHLHPKWQAKVIPLIQRLFPFVQFFITTHSPTVVANFELGTLYIIDNDAINRHESDYFGKQINNVLRNILGASDRHVPTQKKLDELFDLIDRNIPEKYEPLFHDLISLLGEEDIDINKAKALIDWNKYLNDAVH